MFHLPGEFNEEKCLNCSLIFLNPQPEPDELKKYYPSKQYYSYNKSEKKGVFEVLKEYLVAHYYCPNLFSFFISTFIQNVPAMPSRKIKPGKLFDIGCGAGDTILLLKEVGWDVFGVDMDSHAIDVAKKRGLKNVELGTFKMLEKYPDKFFDVIRLYHVIEHVDDPYSCLDLIRKKLKKEGELVMGTPNAESIVSSLFRKYWYNLDAPRHLFLFSPSTLSSLVQKTGFSLRSIGYCGVGGVVGSLQYVLTEILNRQIDLIHNFYIVFLFYPLDWILNKLHQGDVFVLRASPAQ